MINLRFSVKPVIVFGKKSSHRLLLCLITLIISAAVSSAMPFDPDSTEHQESKAPVVSLAPGLMYFLGDVGYSHFNEPMLSKGGFQFEIQKHANGSLALSAFLLAGKVAGEDNTRDRHVNFVSSIL